MPFNPPGTAEQLWAIGPLDGLSEKLRLALIPGPAFEPMVEPGLFAPKLHFKCKN